MTVSFVLGSVWLLNRFKNERHAALLAAGIDDDSLSSESVANESSALRAASDVCASRNGSLTTLYADGMCVYGMSTWDMYTHTHTHTHILAPRTGKNTQIIVAICTTDETTLAIVSSRTAPHGLEASRLSVHTSRLEA